MTNQAAPSETLHAFERAGLGRAPFRYVGMVAQDLLYGQAILNRAEYERTGVAVTTKPGGSCAYCGQYIVNMFRVRSADGREFHVGCDCVEKTGDAKLTKTVKRAAREAVKARKVAARAKRNAAECAEQLALLDAISDACEVEGAFAQHFAADVATRIRSGKQGPMSPRQAELAHKLSLELGIVRSAQGFVHYSETAVSP